MVAEAGRPTFLYALVAALTLVASAPFVVVAFQTWLANESLIDQAQRSHLLLARTAAERIEQRLNALDELVSALAANPQLYQEPQSAAAQEALAGALLGRSQVLAAATFFSDEQRDVLIQMARRPDARWLQPEWLQAAAGEYATLGEQDRLIGLMKATSRPGLRVAAAIAVDGLEGELNPAVAGSTRLVMQARRDPSLFRLGQPVPAAVSDLAASSTLTAGASRFQLEGRTLIGAFAAVANSPWVVISVQPAEEAERARSQMYQAALLAAVVVALLVFTLSAVAWRWVLRPVRRLLAMQRRVLGGDAGSPRSDIADLRQSFQRLQAMAEDREAFDRVFLDRYQVLRILGHGGMGSVFRAWDPKLCRDVAIKTVRVAGGTENDELTLRMSLQNEAIAFARLQHPNVVSVHDYLTREEFAFIVMEFVEGANLKELLNQHRRLPLEQTVAIGTAVLRALKAAHQAGFLHRDIKPANVMVSLNGEVKLGDFGVAARQAEIEREYQQGQVVGTSGYIAPECLLGEPASAQSDLYALGNMLFQCLTGLAPTAAAAGVPLAGEPQRELLRWIESLRMADPQQRPQSAEAALASLPKADLAKGHAELAERVQPLQPVSPEPLQDGYRTRVHAGAQP